MNRDKKNIHCKYCGAILEKDWIALNRKLFDPEIEQLACIKCLADDFCCTIMDLEIKIEEFKESGCTLFM